METALFLGIVIIGIICFKDKAADSWKEFKELIWDDISTQENL